MLVFDATPLIYLAKAGRIEKLEELDQEKIIPEKVYQEVVVEGKNKGKPDAEKIEKLVDRDILEVRKPENNRFERKTEFLSPADIQVLELASQENATAVMDEEYGRNIAEVENIETRGTAFIILKLLKQGAISSEEAQETIDTIIDEGWYCSTNLYKDIMAKIEEI